MFEFGHVQNQKSFAKARSNNSSRCMHIIPVLFIHDVDYLNDHEPTIQNYLKSNMVSFGTFVTVVILPLLQHQSTTHAFAISPLNTRGGASSGSVPKAKMDNKNSSIANNHSSPSTQKERANSVLNAADNSNSDYDDDDEESSYDSYDYEDLLGVDVDVVTDRAGNQAAQSAKQMSNFAMSQTVRFQLGKSYFLSSMLWLSLTMDIVTNSKKRHLIFPIMSSGGLTRQTIFLAMGFMLSALLSYLLSIELKKDNAISPKMGGQKSSSAMMSKQNGLITNDENVRKKLHLYLSLFGLINLGANLNPPSAPFLGMTGFVINVHNSLIALNAWRKDTIVEGQTIRNELLGIYSSVVGLVQSGKRESIGTVIHSMITIALSMGVGISLVSVLSIVGTSLLPYYLTGMVSANKDHYFFFCFI